VETARDFPDEETMQSIDTSTEPRLLNMIGMAVGLWALIGVAITGTWSAIQSSPPPTDPSASRLLAYPPDLPHVPVMAATQAHKQRSASMKVKQRRRRTAASAFVTHAYSPRTSMN
jgi:hypothetical protein